MEVSISRTTTSSKSTYNIIKCVRNLKDTIDKEGHTTSKGAKGINKITLYHQII